MQLKITRQNDAKFVVQTHAEMTDLQFYGDIEYALVCVHKLRLQSGHTTINTTSAHVTSANAV